MAHREAAAGRCKGRRSQQAADSRSLPWGWSRFGLLYLAPDLSNLEFVYDS